MRRTIEVSVEKASEKNYWCSMLEDVENCHVHGTGNSVRAAIESLCSGLKEVEVDLMAEGKEMPDLDFNFKMDVGSFFNYYPINVTAFAKYIGMNASLLRQYASGVKSPSAKSMAKIKAGLEQFKRDLNADILIGRPM